MTIIYPFIISLALSLSLVPLVRWLSYRFNKVKQPREDRWHRQPTPSLGGVGMFVSFVVTIAALYFLRQDFQVHWSLLTATILMFLVGLVDDFSPISPPVKLLAQLLAATIVIFFGNYVILFFRWPIANIILTFFWLIGISNAINLLDNMDGVAGGISLIAAGFVGFFFWRVNDLSLTAVTLALAGSILGFLVFNYPPARIFMGDSGSQFLGFTLASLAIARRTQASNIFAVIGVPTMIFLLPILDTSLVTVTRLLRGQSPAQGGTDHTSHRLIAFGLTERQVVSVLCIVALASGIAGMGLEALDYDLSLAFIPLILIAFSLFTAYLGRLKVVTPVNSSQGNIARLMVNLTYRRRLFEILLDLLLVGTSYYLAFWTRYGLNMTSLSMNLFLRSWPVALLVSYLMFIIFRVYRGIWGFISYDDFIRYGLATVFAAAVSGLTIRFIYSTLPFTNDVFLLFGIFLFLGISATRSSFALLDRFYNRRWIQPSSERVLLFGAGPAGEIAVRWLLKNPGMNYDPIGFIDDDERLWGRAIHGVEIVGGISRLATTLEGRNISGIIVTSSTLLTDEVKQNLLTACQEKGAWVRIMRLDFEDVHATDKL